MSRLSVAQVTRISKMLSKTLRHDPARLGVTLDDGGWIDVDVLLEAFARRGQDLSRADLEYVVEHNDKSRFVIAEGRIRANQGHSIDIDLGLEPVVPPALLFHGTGAPSVDSILANGIHKASRRHVHLSADSATARKVGARHGQPVVLTVLAGDMAAGGTPFYRSANGVWLVDSVPAAFVRR